MTSSSDIALGAFMASKGFKSGKPKPKPQSDGGKCTHCSNMKHTRETCFKLHGHPEWWNDFRHGKNVKGLAQIKARREQLLQVPNHHYLLLLNQNQRILSHLSVIKVTVDKF